MGDVRTSRADVAKALGGESAVCSTRNVELVRSIGTDVVFDHVKQDLARRGARYDLIIDVAGSHPLSRSSGPLDHSGTFVGAAAASIPHGQGASLCALAHPRRIRWAASRGSDPAVAIFVAKTRKDDLAFLGDLAGAGEAPARIDEGRLHGKVAVAIP